MNEKLTAEQRVNDILVWVLRARRNPALADDRDFRESFLQNFGKTAHTAEDECICNLDPDDTCPVKIFNEDCPIHGYEYEEVDGWVICPDCGREIHLPFPDENQIALGKLVEGVHEHGLTWTKELLVIKDWLQQEDK